MSDSPLKHDDGTVVIETTYIQPTTSGEIRWHYEDWGVVVDDCNYLSDEVKRVRIPYKVLDAIHAYSTGPS